MTISSVSRFARFPKAALLTTAFFTLGLAGSATAQTVLYAQGFANDSGSSMPAGDYGVVWHRNGFTAAQSSNVITTTTGSSALANVVGSTPYGEEISAGSWTIGSSSYRMYSYITLPSAIDLAASNPISLSMDLNNNDDTGVFRFVIALDDIFYVSADTFTQGNSWATKSVSLATDSEWSLLSGVGSNSIGVTPGSSALMGLDGDLTAFGFYSEELSGNATRRIDNLVITEAASAIPEPSSAALLFGGVVVAAAMMKRNRRVVVGRA